MTAANLTDLVVTTARHYEKKLADNVSNDNGFFHYLKRNGRIKKYSGGGRTIVEPLLYNPTGNSSAQWYDGYDTFSPQTAFEIVDGAEYGWRQLGGFVAVSGKERKMNRSDEQRFEFIETRIEHLQAQLTNTFATALYSTGTGSGGKELGGLRLLVADDPTAAGTVGGINQVSQSWWRNKYSAAASTSASTITGRLNAMHLQLRRGKNMPNLWVADDTMYAYYEESLQGLQMITTAAEADAGMVTLKYKQKPFIYDDQCPDKHVYALDLNDLTLRIIEDRMFEVGDKRQIANADYEVVPVWTMAQLTTGRRASHGVIIAS